MANYESNSPTSQPSLFPQVSGVPTQSQSASYSNSSGEGSHAGKSLPDVCRRRHGGNAHSEAANVRVHPSKSELKRKILDFVRERVGSTTEEVATGLNLRYTTASGRVSELRRDRELEDSGKTRPTSSGCAATVWITKGTGTK